jgi:hypothetical protein
MGNGRDVDAIRVTTRRRAERNQTQNPSPSIALASRHPIWTVGAFRPDFERAHGGCSFEVGEEPRESMRSCW